MATELVIFDCDGVLVDSERLASRVLRDVLHRFGGNMTTEQVIAVFKGKPLTGHPALALEHFNVTVPADFDTIYHDALFDAFRKELVTIEGVEAILKSLTVPFCAASNSGRDRVALSLDVTNLAPYFGDRVLTVDDVKRGKPAPDIFLLAAQINGVDPAKCIVIEDSPTGVAAGVAAGMTVFGFADLTPAQVLKDAGAKTVFTTMTDLPALINATL
jgi:HAD superfamily hydrolase (TIGR01509 family)